MRQYSYTTSTDLSAELLFKAIAAIERWPDWDHELEWTRLSGEVRVGAPFTLKLRRGPQVAMDVIGMQRPERFSDLARLPLARMRTDHQFASTGAATTVTVTISMSGPLAFVWDRIVARKQAAGAQVQTTAFLAFARALA